MQKTSAPQAAPAISEPAQQPTVPPKKAKARVVRVSLKMPKADHELIAALKKRAAELNRPARKSELLRAGLYSLQKLSDANFRKVLDSLAPLKPARQKRSGHDAPTQ